MKSVLKKFVIHIKLTQKVIFITVGFEHLLDFQDSGAGYLVPRILKMEHQVGLDYLRNILHAKFQS